MSIVVNKTRLPATEWKTEKASVVSVNDARMRAAKEVVVEINPVQDLHGYDSPWAGGAGKNLAPFEDVLPDGYTKTERGITVTVHNGVVHLEGVSESQTTWNILDFQTVWNISGISNYPISAGTYSNATGLTCRISSVNKGGTFTITETSYIRGFYIFVPGNKYQQQVNQDIVLAITAGSTIPTEWTPYENICPITGWTGCKTYDDPRYGGLVKWNQQLANPDDWTAHSVQTSFSCVDGVITATLVSGSPTVYSPAISPSSSSVSVTGIPGHKYYFACKFKPATKGYPYLMNNTAFTTAAVFGSQLTQAGEWGEYKNIVNAHTTGGDAWYIGQGGETSSIQIGDSFSIKDMVCIDLTEAFGAGNEPSTVEQVCSLFPKDSYPCDTSGNEKTVSEVNGEPHREVTVTFPVPLGKNLVDSSILKTTGGNYNKWNCPNILKNNTKYTYSVFGANTYGYRLMAGHTNQSVPQPNIGLNSGYTKAGNSSTFTTPSDIEDWEYLFFGGSASGANTSGVWFQVEEGETGTAYERYQGDELYGGKLDIVSGKLTIENANIFVREVTGRSENENGYFWYNTTVGLYLDAIEDTNSGLMTDRFINDSNVAVSDPEGVITFYANGIIRWKEKGSSTLSEYAEYLKNNPFQMVYKLKEPRTIWLSPNELEMFLRNNNIWSDTGETQVTYAAIRS